MSSPLHEVTLITQNVDDLHERGGCYSVWHMHGQLLKKRCEWCGAVSDCNEDLSKSDRCLQCEQTGGMRPDIVWFGEMPYFLDEIDGVLSDCDLFVAIGTSGAVYPAGNFVNLARLSGSRTLELNLVRTENSGNFDEVREGPASVKVAEWVDELLAE